MRRAEFANEIDLVPAFHDLDPMAVVWHGNYLKYFEIARCALLQRFNYDYQEMHASGYLWPIVDMRTKYVRSARINQKLRVRAQIVEWENRLKIEYLITDALGGEVLTRGHSIQVAVLRETGEMQFASPPVLFERLGIAAP
jgi:acyl-CoA thioester hydrolase